MSANEPNRFDHIHLSNHFSKANAPTDQAATRQARSDQARTDQPASAAVNLVNGPHPGPLFDVRPLSNVGGASCGASPPQAVSPRLLRNKTQHNAVPRPSMADAAPPWQARAASRPGGFVSASLSDTSGGESNGHSSPAFDDADESFDDDVRASRNVIVIIDERALVRDCLMHCLQAAYGGHTVLAFATLSDWMRVEIDYPVPSVILLSVQNRRKAPDNADDVEYFTRLAMRAPLIIISDVEDGSRIMRAIEKGARGYIPTSMTLGIAVEAVRLVEAGGTFVPINSLMSSSQNQADGSHMFTARQIMVVEALCRGKANKQIAYELGMCESTVKVHIRHIMRKLKARNRTEVAMMASNLFDKFLDQKTMPDT
jgi:DNA-binding NarL/FixJ family response regulator